MSTQRTALLTGATGFVGSRLVGGLLRGGWHVHVIVRPSSTLAQLDDLRDRIVVHTYDGTTESLVAIVARARPDLGFHLASLFLADHRTCDVGPLLHSNVVFPTQFVEALVSSGVKRMVNTGSFAQHFQNQDYSPSCLYAATKQAFEAILQYFSEAMGLSAITLTLFDTYGPDDPRKKLFFLLRQAARQQSLLRMSPGEQLIDLVYIDDVVNAFVVAAEMLVSMPPGHSTYAVSSGSPIRLKDAVMVYARTTGLTPPIEWGGRSYRTREIMVPWNRGAPLPGWHPTVDLEQGIKLMEGLERQAGES